MFVLFSRVAILWEQQSGRKIARCLSLFTRASEAFLASRPLDSATCRVENGHMP